MNLISVDDISEDLLKAIFVNKTNSCKGKTLATLFFEPSTRTRISFESAAHYLGMDVITASTDLSVKKNESIKDTLVTISRLVDLIVIRHPENIFLRTNLLNNVKCPVINAGNSSWEHPTQALLDFYTIKDAGNKILFVGDLGHSRTFRSLTKLLSRFDYEIYTYSHPRCQVPADLTDLTNEINPSEILDVLSEIDFLYMIRPQTERFTDVISFDKFKLTQTWLNALNPNASILHALPRTAEIPEFVDDDPRAKYFDQVENGLLVRKRLLSYIIHGL